MILHKNLSKRFKSFLISSSRQIHTNFITNCNQFHTWTHTLNRIGPHNVDVISILVGCLLGDAYAKISKSKVPGTNFRFKQSGRHKDYLFSLVKILNKFHSLQCTIQKIDDRYSIYILKESIPRLRELVLPHVVPSMVYKLNVKVNQKV